MAEKMRATISRVSKERAYQRQCVCHNIIPCLADSSRQLSLVVPSFAVKKSFQNDVNCLYKKGPSSSFLGSMTTVRNFISSTDKSKPDPSARRPNAKCDPYGQGGKPLPWTEAKTLLMTVDPQWILEEDESNDSKSQNDDSPLPPKGLVREFIHPDFMTGSQFIAKMAAVAQVNDHYPSILLERRIIPSQKAWQVVTRIRCHTLVLGGLSTHDFHLAMVRYNR